MFELTPTFLKTDNSLPGFLGRLKNEILDFLFNNSPCELWLKHVEYLKSISLAPEEKELLKDNNAQSYLNFSKTLPVGFKSLVFEQVIELSVTKEVTIRIHNSGPNAFGSHDKVYAGVVSIINCNAVTTPSYEISKTTDYSIPNSFTELPVNIQDLLLSFKEKRGTYSPFEQAHFELVKAFKRDVSIFDKNCEVTVLDLPKKDSNLKGNYILHVIADLRLDPKNENIQFIEEITYADIVINFKENVSRPELEYRVQLTFDLVNREFKVRFFAPTIAHLLEKTIALSFFKDEIYMPELTAPEIFASQAVNKALDIISSQIDP